MKRALFSLFLVLSIIATLSLTACTNVKRFTTTVLVTQTVTQVQTVTASFVGNGQTQTITLPAETVTVTETIAEGQTQAPTTTTSVSDIGMSRDNPVPMGQTILTSEGIEITVIDLIKGDAAWSIIEEANMFNDEPAEGMQYIIVTVKMKNVSSEDEPWSTYWDIDLTLVGSSNIGFSIYDNYVVLPESGDLSEIDADLYHGGETIGSLCFEIPEDETDLVLIADFVLFWEDLIYYFEVE